MPSPSSLNQNQVVRAGAGAGKTTRLIHQIFENKKSFEGSHNPRMVVTTFTRKATQELRERLFQKALEEGDFKLLEYFSSSSLWISTIHGVLNLFLKRYGFHIGLDPSFRLISSQEDIWLSAKVLKGILLSQKPKILKDKRFFELREMVESYRKYKISTSGEFKPIQEDELRELYRGFKEDVGVKVRAILEKAELNEKQMGKIEAWLKEWEKRPLEKLTEELLKIPLSTKIDDLKELQKDLERIFLPKVFPHIETLVSAFQEFQILADRFVEEIHEEKVREGLLTYDDLELLSLQALEKEKTLSSLFSKDWDFWLVDEYQDVSPLQVKLMEKLRGKAPEFVVGDPQQSIYLFRGARKEVFEEKEKEIKKTGGKLENLEFNYRSHPHLLSFLNEFLEKFSFSPMKTLKKEKEKVREEDVVATVGAFETEESEKEALLHHILTLQSQNVSLKDICILNRKQDDLKATALFLKKHHIPIQVHISSSEMERREVLDALALLKFLVNPHDSLNLVLLLRSPWCRVSDTQLASVFSKRPFSYWRAVEKELLPQYKRLQFLKELLEDSEKKGLSFSFERGLKELGFFDLCLTSDPTGLTEAHLWRWVQALKEAERQPGFQALKFLSLGLEKQEGGEPLGVWEAENVHLMTVHGSKGLEFHHILFPYLAGKPRRTNALPFVFDEEKNWWSFSLFSTEQGESLSPLSSQLALKKIRKREEEEDERLLYVALTRAKKSIYLSWCGRAQKGTLAQSIEPRLPKEFKGLKILKESSPSKRLQKPDLGGRFSSYSYQKPFSSSFSPKISQGLFSTSKLLGDVKIFGLGSTQKGLKLHDLMEVLSYKESFDVSSINWLSLKEKSEFQKACSYLEYLSEPPIKKLFKVGFTEWGFQLQTHKGFLEGRLDLWGEVDNKVWIVDYKSGSSQNKERAFKQLQLYSLSLRRKGYGKDIHLAVVYPFSQEVHVILADSEEGVLKSFEL